MTFEKRTNSGDDKVNEAITVELSLHECISLALRATDRHISKNIERRSKKTALSVTSVHDRYHYAYTPTKMPPITDRVLALNELIIMGQEELLKLDPDGSIHAAALAQRERDFA